MKIRMLGLACAIVLFAATSACADGLEGRWRSGSWSDNNSGHTGPLRARFRMTDTGNYRVVFTGRFAKVVPFRYATRLNVVGQDGDKTIFAGESRLPLFGRFTYNGVGTAQRFNMQYDSRRYTGEFNLER